MTTVLALSSWVGAGHVGLSAARPALEALGAEALCLPTVVLSNHLGWKAAAGRPVPVAQLEEMVAAFAANGWLSRVDAVLTGYLPTAEHAALAARIAAKVKAARPGARLVCDPVLGDAPKGLYVAEAVAEAVRDRLAPLADLLTPNIFELGWLTGAEVATAGAARAAARRLCASAPARRVVVTSPPLGDGLTGLMEVSEAEAQVYAAPLRQGVPHGVGDVLSALLAAGLGAGAALGLLSALIDDSLGRPSLRIAGPGARWTGAAPVAAAGLAG